MMLRYVNGYIFEGHTFVVNKCDIHNAKDEKFAEGTALMPDGWISVKDRLPDVNKKNGAHEEATVITCCNGYVRPLIYERAVVRGKTVYRWRWMWDRIFDDDDKITHWMPLPEPPKGDDDDE